VNDPEERRQIRRQARRVKARTTIAALLATAIVYFIF